MSDERRTSKVVSIVGATEQLDVELAVLQSERPECAEDSERLRWAVALAAADFHWPINACGTMATPTEHVRSFGLEGLVRRRRESRWN